MIAAATMGFAHSGVRGNPDVRSDQPTEREVKAGRNPREAALTSFLMVCTWRYPSFKDLSLTSPRSPLSFIAIGSFIYLIWNFSRPLLLVLTAIYVMSGILTRLGGMIRRALRPRVAQ